MMNKREKEILQSQLNNEKKTLNELKQVYKKALGDINDNIAALQARTDTENLQSIIYQVDYQNALKKQIEGVLDELNTKQFTSISEYLTNCYEDGFVGTMYNIHGQGIPLIFPIDQKQVVKAVQIDSKISEGLYKRLGVDTKKLKDSIRANVSRGIASSQSWTDVARNIDNRMKVGMNNSMRIARTEGHRISATSAYDAAIKSKEAGADVVKQWDAALDGRTRPEHAQLDGQIREIDEPFVSGNGHKAMYPGGFGIAALDINCRCAGLTRARWALGEEELQTLKDRAEYFGLDKTTDFDDFKKKYLDISKNASYNDSVINSSRGGIIKSVKIPDDLEYLLQADTNFNNKDIDVKILQTINDSISSRKAVTNDFDFSEIKIARFSGDDKSVFITDYEVFGGKERTKLYLNTEFFSGQTTEQLDKMCLGYYEVGWWKSKSVGDLVNHEIMHARINYHNSFEKVERLYGELRGDARTKGFCRMVDTNPEEFLNEMYVAMCNGEEIDLKYVEIFDEYTKEFLGG